MFELSETYEVNRNTLNGDYRRWSPSEISTINSANSQR